MAKESAQATTAKKDEAKQMHEVVRGIFRNYETPGGGLAFCYGSTNDGFKKYTFEDGKIYSVPLKVAYHLNTGCYYPVHEYRQDEYGKMSQLVGRKVRRFGFQSLEFTNPKDIGEFKANEIMEPAFIAR